MQCFVRGGLAEESGLATMGSQQYGEWNYPRMLVSYQQGMLTDLDLEMAAVLLQYY
jgi:hypothetical protein